MIERDYIMRMIQQLASVLAKVLLHKEQGQIPEAFREIDEASKGLIGMKWDFLRSFSAEQLSALLGAGDHPDKLLAASELLREGSVLLALEGKTEENVQQGMKAFSLFTEFLSRDRRDRKLLPVEKFAALLTELETQERTVEFEKKRFQFYELAGELAKAKTVLEQVIALEPAFRREEHGFYRRLEKISDEDLQKGGLAREDVVRGLEASKAPRRRSR